MPLNLKVILNICYWKGILVAGKYSFCEKTAGVRTMIGVEGRKVLSKVASWKTLLRILSESAFEYFPHYGSFLHTLYIDHNCGERAKTWQKHLSNAEGNMSTNDRRPKCSSCFGQLS
ncbi:hypothetical protein Bbelb_333160 [Branchiostoma belcheri]|nr:hypothetical protein Bbelb_333160 [Branchiostoma belcheri]